MDYSKLSDIEVDGIDMKDYPDFVDAYISSGNYDCRPLTEEEMDLLQSDYDFLYEQIINRIY